MYIKCLYSYGKFRLSEQPSLPSIGVHTPASTEQDHERIGHLKNGWSKMDDCIDARRIGLFTLTFSSSPSFFCSLSRPPVVSVQFFPRLNITPAKVGSV